MSKLYILIIDQVGTGDDFNNLKNVIVGHDHVVIANSLQKAKHMILEKHYYMIGVWEETSDKKFDSLTDQEKEKAIDTIFKQMEGEIFEIEMSGIDGIEKYTKTQR
uniref:Uncharacterized protein n=1 Tax=Pithovirus LCPAC202 TaxID=2506592 RepID=A0A481Z5P0_9VIRU|nr:MAG: hypothetical protein LCPAC202_01870 [Pithovirus LCPAC202]